MLACYVIYEALKSFMRSDENFTSCVAELPRDLNSKADSSIEFLFWFPDSQIECTLSSAYKYI